MSGCFFPPCFRFFLFVLDEKQLQALLAINAWLGF